MISSFSFEFNFSFYLQKYICDGSAHFYNFIYWQGKVIFYFTLLDFFKSQPFVEKNAGMKGFNI